MFFKKKEFEHKYYRYIMNIEYMDGAIEYEKQTAFITTDKFENVCRVFNNNGIYNEDEKIYVCSSNIKKMSYVNTVEYIIISEDTHLMPNTIENNQIEYYKIKTNKILK